MPPAPIMPDLEMFKTIPQNADVRVEDLTMPNGDRLVGSDGLLIPPARNFSMIVNAATRVYSYRFDEAMRDNMNSARAMRRDAFLLGLLEERILPTINRNFILEVDDDRDPEQQFVRTGLTKLIKNIHNFDAMKRALLDATWFGRAGVGWTYQKQEDADNLWGIGKWDPVHGDSVQFSFDGHPCIMMDASTAAWYSTHGAKYGPPGVGDLVPTDRGGTALQLHRPQWRERYAIHQHILQKADYFEGEMAGSVQGFGLRGQVYWQYVVRTDALTWMLAYMQAVGQMDLLVFNYPTGNYAAQQQQEMNAQKIIGKAAIACPRVAGGNWPAVEQIPMNSAGLAALQRLVADYFDRHIERLIVGQSMSSGADKGSGLGGTGRAEFARATKDEILVYDAKRLDQTLSHDLIKPLKKYNFPWAKFPVRFKSILPDSQAQEKVMSGKVLISVGIPIKADELREAAGYSRPDAGDDVVGAPQPPPGPPEGGGGAPPEGGPPPGPQVSWMGAPAQFARTGTPTRYLGGMGFPGGSNTHIPKAEKSTATDTSLSYASFTTLEMQPLKWQLDRLTKQDLDGVKIWVNEVERKIYFNLLDWANEKVVKPLIEAAKKIVGDRNVQVVHEGEKPFGSGWKILYSRGNAVSYETVVRPVMYSHQAFQANIRQEPHEDFHWLVYADWLDENGHPEAAERARWWAGARDAMRQGRRFDVEHLVTDEVYDRVNDIQPDWVRRLWGVEHGRHVMEKYHPDELAKNPPHATWQPLPEIDAQTQRVIDDTNHISLMHSMGLASDAELAAAGNAAYNAAGNAAYNAAGNAAYNAAGNAAWNAAGNAAGNAAWNAAGNAAGNAAWNAAHSSLDALHEYIATNPIPGEAPPPDDEAPTMASRYATVRNPIRYGVHSEMWKSLREADEHLPFNTPRDTPEAQAALHLGRIYGDVFRDEGREAHAETIEACQREYQDNGLFGLGSVGDLQEGQSWLLINPHGYDSWTLTAPHQYTLQLGVSAGMHPYPHPREGQPSHYPYYLSFARSYTNPAEALEFVEKLRSEGAVFSDEDRWGYDLLREHAGASPRSPGVRTYLKRRDNYSRNGESSTRYTTPHKCCSTQVDLVGESQIRVLQASSGIAQEDLVDKGRELNAHCTIRYGIECDPKDVAKLVGKFGPIKVRLTRASVFECPDHDVLKYEVDSSDLHRLNRLLKTLPGTDTHPEYKPHATVAYVRKGKGGMYASALKPLNLDVTLDGLFFSNKEGVRTWISTTGKPAPMVQTDNKDNPEDVRKYGPAEYARLRTPQHWRRESRLSRYANPAEEGADRGPIKPGVAPTREDALGTWTRSYQALGLTAPPSAAEFGRMWEDSQVVSLAPSDFFKLGNTSVSPEMIGRGFADPSVIQGTGMVDQSTPSWDSIKHHAAGLSADPVVAVDYGGKLVLLDGDHRVVASALANQPLQVRVIQPTGSAAPSSGAPPVDSPTLAPSPTPDSPQDARGVPLEIPVESEDIAPSEISGPKVTSTRPLELDYASHESFIASVRDALGSHGYADESSEAEATEGLKAFSKIPRLVYERLKEGRMKAVVSHPDLGAVQTAWVAAGGNDADAAHGDLLGFFDPNTWTTSVNGVDRVGTLTHEMGHALDYSSTAPSAYHQFSGSREWQRAHNYELASGALSDYAMLNQQESFAEFCRFVYSTEGGDKIVKALFPMSFRLFVQWGLV